MLVFTSCREHAEVGQDVVLGVAPDPGTKEVSRVVNGWAIEQRHDIDRPRLSMEEAPAGRSKHTGYH